ncbi:MAG TPA: HAMP domain-containing histidine kinase [Anaerolineae bacterium]|nr:HAMP domain-containing histidine kinase [Anaerolineae bacterium]
MSIRIRLTLWYVSLLAVILITFSVAFYTVLQYSLTTELDRSLQERAQQVAAGIRALNDPLDILRFGVIRLPELDVFSSRSIYIQITDAQGDVIKRSPNLMGRELPIDQEILNNLRAKQPIIKTMPIGSMEMRLYSAPLVSGDGDVLGMVQVGNPVGEIQATLRRVLLFLVSGTIISLGLAMLGGVWLVYLSLRPIERITETANRIVSAEDLKQRLPVPPTDDELARLSRTINLMLERLDNFFQAQVRLSADVSHELRTPLTIIRGNVDILRRMGDSPTDREEALNAIESALNRMARLVSDLLLLSQADAGMTLKMQPIDLDGVILDVFQQAHALRNGVELKLGHADPARVYGDADRLKQLLINLMENAIKHTPKGGSVTLSVYRGENTVRISVADTGAGIAPEHLPHIFDRFYRVKGQRVKGSGLGLAIAKWIAEAHNGTLTAESEPGIGSTFILTLPLLKEADSHQQSAVSGQRIA